MFRRRRPEPIASDPIATLDLAAVPTRLVGLVRDALDARHRWLEISDLVAAGPLADRLREMGERVDAGVLHLHATAVRAGEVERILATLDPVGAADAYKAAKRRAVDGHPPPELEALEARFTSVQRILNASADADERLRLLEARLLAVVARGAEVALTADPIAVQALDHDLSGLVGELGALSNALRSLG